MNDHAHVPFELVLALYPTATGFGWVLFESALSPLEWGTPKPSKNRNTACLESINGLIERFRPSEIVLEQFEGEPAHRHRRIRRLYKGIIDLARNHGIEPRILTREAIAQAFAKFKATDRYTIATVVASHIESFAHLLPPKRKIWNPENPRMGLFNAAALAITYFALLHGEPFNK